MNHGDRREEVFRDGKDRERFQEKVCETCARLGWKTAIEKLLR